MKFLVLGVNGMAGHMIAAYLSECGYDVVGFALTESPYVPTIVGDATDRASIKKALRGEYDVVINCIGILNSDAENHRAEAVLLNSWLPHFLADETAEMHTRVFQMSTDCVFAGNTGPYTENSFPDGRTFYDRSKALGELVDKKNLTFRNSIVGPDRNIHGIGLLNWFMGQNGSIFGFKNAIWTGLTTLELAKAMEACAKDGTTGLVNMVPDVSISKHDLLILFNKYFKHGSTRIEPFDNELLDKTLQRTNYESAFLPSSYDNQVRELADWVRAHSDYYPHYEMD